MGPRRGAHALFTGEWMSADDAVASGIALSSHAPADVLPAAMALAGRIAAYPLDSLKAIKSTVAAGRRDQSSRPGPARRRFRGAPVEDDPVRAVVVTTR